MRSLVVLGALFWIGCDPATAVLLDGNALDSDEDPSTVDDPGTDSGDLDSSDPDSEDGDPDTEEVEPGTDPPVFYRWRGEREFTFEEFSGDCTDTLVETGDNVTDDPEYEDAFAACGCNYIFLVDNDKDRLCPRPGFRGYEVTPTVLRGIGAVNGEVRVYTASLANPTEWGELPPAEGGWSGFTYEYDGTIRVGAFEVDYEVEGEGSVQ